jgi:hypothetical protein
VTVDAGLDLFKAVRSVLVADTYIASQVGSGSAARIYSSWGNQTVTAPFIRFWLGTTAPFEMDGAGEGSETDFSVYVFTSEPAQTLCRTIAAKVKDLLHNQDPALDGSYCVSFLHKNTIMSRDDEDPNLQMAVVRFTALTTTK